MWLYCIILRVARNQVHRLVAKGLRFERYCDEKRRLARINRENTESMGYVLSQAQTEILSGGARIVPDVLNNHNVTVLHPAIIATNDRLTTNPNGTVDKQARTKQEATDA